MKCCDQTRAVFRQNMVWFPIEGDGHPTIDTDIDTHYKDSYCEMDDHKPYTRFWLWHIWSYMIVYVRIKYGIVWYKHA